MNSAPSTSESADRPSDLLSTLLSNPEALQRVASIVGSALSAPTTGKENADAAASVSSATDTEGVKGEPSTATSALLGDTSAGIPGGLASVLSNPAMLERLPQIIAVMKPLLAAQAPSKPSAHENRSPEACRNNLLLALKPFLCAERCDAIDSIIRISQLGAVFSQLK